MPKASTTEADGAKGGPSKWWQWVILYPTLAISFLSAAPQWVDKAQAMFNGVEDRGWDEAKQQQDAWRANLTCSAAPFDWYSTPENLKVDATICNSGDIFVRVATPKQGKVTTGKQVSSRTVTSEVRKKIGHVLNVCPQMGPHTWVA